MVPADRHKDTLPRLLRLGLLSAPPGLDSLVVKQSKLNSAIAFQRQQAFFFRYAWTNFKIRYLKGVLSRALESTTLLSGDFFGDEPHSKTFGTLARYLFFRAIGAKGVLSNLAVAATLAGALVQNNCVSFFSSKYCFRGFSKRDARFRLFFCKGSFRSLYFRSGGRRVRCLPALSKSVKLSLYFRQVSLLKARFKVRSFLTRYQNTVWSTPGRTVLSSAANLFAPRFSRWTERETLSTRVAKRTDVVKFTRKKSCLLNFLQFIWVIKRILFSAARLGGVRLLAVALLSLEKRWGYISLSGPFIFCGVKFQGLHWRVIIISFIEKYSLKAFGFFEKFGGHPFVLLKIAQYFSPYVGQKHFKQAWPWESLPVQALISKAQDRFRRWFKHVDCGKLNIVLPPATCGKRKSGSGANIGCHLLARDVTPYHKLSVNYEYFSYSPCFLYPRCKTMSVAARKLYIVRTRRHLSARTRLKFVQSLSCTIKPGNLWEIASLFIELANTLSYAEIIKYFSFRAKIQKNAFRNCFFFRYTIWRGLSNESFKIVSQRIF